MWHLKDYFRIHIRKFDSIFVIFYVTKLVYQWRRLLEYHTIYVQYLIYISYGRWNRSTVNLRSKRSILSQKLFKFCYSFVKYCKILDDILVDSIFLKFMFREFGSPI